MKHDLAHAVTCSRDLVRKATNLFDEIASIKHLQAPYVRSRDVHERINTSRKTSWSTTAIRRLHGWCIPACNDKAELIVLISNSRHELPCSTVQGQFVALRIISTACLQKSLGCRLCSVQSVPRVKLSMAERKDVFPTNFPSSSKPAQLPAAGSCGHLFSQFKELLDSAEAKVTGYDKLHSSLQEEKRSVEQLQEALLSSQRHIDTCAKQNSVLETLTRQLEAKSHALKALDATLQKQGLQYETAQAEAMASQQELGRKRKRMEQLEYHNVSKQQRIEQLEQELQAYRGICSYVTAHTQVHLFFAANRLLNSLQQP